MISKTSSPFGFGFCNLGFLHWGSGRLFFRRKLFFFVLIITRLVSLVCLLFSYLPFFRVRTFLKRVRRLVLVWLIFWAWFPWRFPSSPLLRHWTRISIMKRFGFLQIESSRFLRLLLLLLLLFILYVNIIIISISRVHLIRHIKSTEIWRDKLSTCYFRTPLLTWYQSCWNFPGKLTSFKLRYPLCLFLNPRSSIVCLLFSFCSLVHRIWRLVLILLVFWRLVYLSILALVLSNLGRSLPCFRATSLSWMASSRLRSSPVCLDVFLNKFFYFRLSHPVKVGISQCL